MAIINKDGFAFYTDINGNPESLILTGLKLNDEIDYIIKNDIISISLNYFESQGISDLEFLSSIKFIENITIDDLDIDYSGLYFLYNLKYAILSVKSKKQHLDYSKLKSLEYLSIDWYPDFPDLSKNEELKELVVWKFRPKSKSLSVLKLPRKLKRLEITDSNILNLEGLNLDSLEKFEGHYCNYLLSLSGIKHINYSLNTLIFEHCKKLSDYSELVYCKNLVKIIFGECGDIPNLEWLKKLQSIKYFSFWNTKLIDGDLSSCIGIPFISFKDAKHYSHKEAQFKSV